MVKTDYKVGDKVVAAYDIEYPTVKKGTPGEVGYVGATGCEVVFPSYDADSRWIFFREIEPYDSDDTYLIKAWNGGECPVAPDTEVLYWLRFATPPTTPYKANCLNWSHSGQPYDIIAYQVVQKPKVVRPKEIWVLDGLGAVSVDKPDDGAYTKYVLSDSET